MASFSFVEMAVEARRELPDFGGNERLSNAFAPHIEAAVTDGEVRPDLQAADVLTGVRMIYGLVITSVGRTTLASTVTQVSKAWFGPPRSGVPVQR